MCNLYGNLCHGSFITSMGSSGCWMNWVHRGESLFYIYPPFLSLKPESQFWNDLRHPEAYFRIPLYRFVYSGNIY